MATEQLSRSRLVFFIALSLALSSAQGTALAQPASSNTKRDRDAARVLAEKGIDLFESKRYAEAIDQLQQAESRFHAPTHLYLIAQAYKAMGKLVLAKKHYKLVADEPLANYAPEAFLEAQRDAKSELAALLPRIPGLRISVNGVDAADVRVRVDGEEAADWKSAPVDVEPGEHLVQATSSLGEKTETVRVNEGQTIDVAFAWDALAKKASEGTPESSAKGPLWPAFVAFGAGGVGIAAGAIMGGAALSKMGELADRCPTKQCDPADQPLADSARTFAHISTASFVLGGVGAAAGVVLFVLRPGGSSASSEAAIKPWIGLGQAGVAGRF